MDENYEVVKERNEKNKAFRKWLKIYYIVKYGVAGVLLLGSGVLCTLTDSKIAVIMGLCILVAIFVAWFLWCIMGGSKICCPHCNNYIGRSDPWRILKCPYCGTSLEILEFFEREKL